MMVLRHAIPSKFSLLWISLLVSHHAVATLAFLVASPSLVFCRHDEKATTTACLLGPSSSSTTQTDNDIDVFKTLPTVNDDDGLGPYDFGVTDSLQVPNAARPSLWETIANPRDGLAVLLLLGGGLPVAWHNICGMYDDTYQLVQGFSIVVGLANALAVAVQLQTNHLISLRPRMGIVDDAVLATYAALYSAASCWLALRTCTFCPSWLTKLDWIFPCLAAAIFAYCLAAPVVTLYEHASQTGDVSARMVRLVRGLSPCQSIPTRLSETELFRVKGLIFIGILGCVFVPACCAFAWQGQEWWHRVTEFHSKQQLLESTDALFALFATEASMIATRAASAGVAPFRKTVPAFAAVCLLLALVPCACSLHWLGEDISFFSFYTE